jgi:hypothetical protein
MKNLEKTIEKTAQILNLEKEELELWLAEHPQLSQYIQMQLLRLAAKYQLDPLANEIGVMETIEGYQPYITIDGWLTLINGHEQYAGMSLREPAQDQPSETKIPEWMECTIYRHDRILPIIVKEYLDEVKTDQLYWQQMPRRMLRHRVIQQCARLAFGIGQADRITGMRKADPEIQKIQSNQAFIKSQKNHQTKRLKSLLQDE